MDTVQLSERLRETLAVFTAAGEPLTTSEVTESLDVGRRSTFDRLEDLVEEGHLETKNAGSSGRVWWRPVRRQPQEWWSAVDPLLDAVHDGVYATDGDGRFVFVNDAFVSMSDRSREQLLGAHGSVFFGDRFVDTDESEWRELVAGERDAVAFEAEIEGADGEIRTVHNQFVHLEIGDEIGRVGVTRDVTERKEYERELERYVGIIDAVDEPVYELDAAGRFTFVNDGFVQYSGYSASELLGRHVSIGMDEDAIERAMERIADLIENDPEGTATLEYEVVTKAGDRVPVENRISLLFDDDGQFKGTSGVLWDISERKAREAELERQREELTVLNNVNRVGRHITEAVIEQSTRTEIESTVCTHLAEAESYRFAWIGDVDVNTQTVQVRAEAGVEGYLDGVTISVDPDDERSRGPTGRALLTGEMQTVRDNESHDPWRERTENHDVRSSAAVPIVHEGTTYGVLNVYADRPEAFEGQERTVISQLGEVIGHAIAATERKRALMSDEIVELEFLIPEVFEAVGADAAAEGTITLDHAVPLEDGAFLVYGTATPEAVESVEALVAALAHWEKVTFRSDGEAFELRLSEPPVLSVLASLGGSVEEVRIEDSDYHMTLHVAPTVESRRVVEAVTSTYPSAELRRRQQRARSDRSPDDVRRVMQTALTERQRAALEAAFHAGFYEWPRERSAEEIARSFGVAAPTFHYHLRTAERKVLDALL